ncbi:MAG: hypothetical protein WCK90_01955 [archaeon]
MKRLIPGAHYSNEMHEVHRVQALEEERSLGVQTSPGDVRDYSYEKLAEVIRRYDPDGHKARLAFLEVIIHSVKYMRTEGRRVPMWMREFVFYGMRPMPPKAQRIRDRRAGHY